MFGDSQNKALENCLTAYVKNSIGDGIDPVHHLSAFIPADQFFWLEASYKAFEFSKIIETGNWHNLTPKIESKVFKNAKEKFDFWWQDIQGSWAIFAPGVPLRIRTDGGQGHKTFSTIPVPYVAVTLDSHGTLNRYLRTECLMLQLCAPKFLVEIGLPCSNLVEQALLGYVEWDNRMVLREARHLLAMSEKDFAIFYETLLQAAAGPLDIMLEEVVTQERAYEDKPFYNDIEAGRRNDIASDDDVMLPCKGDQLTLQWQGKGVDREYAMETTSPPITPSESNDIPRQTQTYEPRQASHTPANPHDSPPQPLWSQIHLRRNAVNHPRQNAE
ncbi:e7508049-1b3d-4631-8d3f-fa210ad472e8 [Sclerotinia trifoliorum]|uniref:E7508049-1b3d-4631-8d3f-fa210ad472e8 n=1 Tax=Sclerotinia trifoliorum TaxID=28548 RepID=A0A8H2VNS3_9HELO|nr:e7508049-1b3d-4631-8d3f-fa210ad472e8 [Sclerotinia trifoliorum]